MRNPYTSLRNRLGQEDRALGPKEKRCREVKARALDEESRNPGVSTGSAIRSLETTGAMELRAGTGTCLPFNPPPQRGGRTQKHDGAPQGLPAGGNPRIENPALPIPASSVLSLTPSH